MIADYITGKDLRETPEENVRQQYAKVLHAELGYPKDCMDIEVPIQMGSSSNKRADICIYENEKKEKIIGIVEVKAKDNSVNLEQLKSYMSATHSCRWGVATNGADFEYALKTSSEIIFPNSFVIPKHGEEASKIRSRDNLEKVQFLKRIFRKINHDLYSNTNLPKSSKQGAEMVRILFCKLFDEQEDNVPLEFQVRDNEEPKATKSRIEERLWSKLKRSFGKDIFAPDEKLELDAASFVKVVRELQRYSLFTENKDVIGEAFEVFAEKQFAGEKGQFFTPRTVVDMCIRMVQPEEAENILDPACGSGGFLIAALNYVRAKNRGGGAVPIR